MRSTRLAFVAFLLAFAVATAVGRPALALVGSCATNAINYFSVVCYQSTTKWSGIFARWNSVPLNITQSSAQAGEFISEAVWLYDQFSGPYSWLELGDTAGGGLIGGHVNEWSRMWYWVRGSQGGGEFDSFYAYSPSDSSSHSYGFQYSSSWGGWDLCIDGVCGFGYGWKDPSLFVNTRAFTGMEVYNGRVGNQPRPLDASKNSGLFTSAQMQLRFLDTSWTGWPSATKQVDSPCGTAPTCLQGYWTVPPYDNFNNAKPAQ